MSRRLPALTLRGLLAVGLVVGVVTVGSTPAIAAHARSCVGDDSSAPRGSQLIGYSSLGGGTFSKRESRARGKVLEVGAGSVTLHDFVAHPASWDGALIGPHSSGLLGSGIGRTTVRLAPHSSTRKKDIPSAFPRTNQLSVLRLVGSATVLRGFTLRGTAQGHPYNGIRVEKVQNLRADHVRVLGIPGDDHAPPGETFAINDYRTRGSRWSHIRIDGDHVGASGFATNSSTDIRICDAVSKNNPAAMGFAFWQSSGITCIDCRAYDNGFSGFNFERTSGRVTLVRPAASGNRYGMRIASDRASARFTIVDPVLVDGRWTVWLPRHWYGSANRQKRSDITLVLHGRKRDDLLRIRSY